jgi:protein TonB
VGVAGSTPGAGNSARSPRSGSGQGGSPAELPQRPGGKAATTARAQEAYIRMLKKRVHEKLVYPPELAAALEQGEVVVAFTLRSDGSVADVRISRPSGYDEFDAAAVRAVRQAAPFGPVPASVRGGRDTLRTSVPITFANPLIR